MARGATPLLPKLAVLDGCDDGSCWLSSQTELMCGREQRTSAVADKLDGGRPLLKSVRQRLSSNHWKLSTHGFSQNDRLDNLKTVVGMQSFCVSSCAALCACMCVCYCVSVSVSVCVYMCCCVCVYAVCVCCVYVYICMCILMFRGGAELPVLAGI